MKSLNKHNDVNKTNESMTLNIMKEADHKACNDKSICCGIHIYIYMFLQNGLVSEIHTKHCFHWHRWIVTPHLLSVFWTLQFSIVKSQLSSTVSSEGDLWRRKRQTLFQCEQTGQTIRKTWCLEIMSNFTQFALLFTCFFLAGYHPSLPIK